MPNIWIQLNVVALLATLRFLQSGASWSITYRHWPSDELKVSLVSNFVRKVNWTVWFTVSMLSFDSPILMFYYYFILRVHYCSTVLLYVLQVWLEVNVNALNRILLHAPYNPVRYACEKSLVGLIIRNALKWENTVIIWLHAWMARLDLEIKPKHEAWQLLHALHEMMLLDSDAAWSLSSSHLHRLVSPRGTQVWFRERFEVDLHTTATGIDSRLSRSEHNASSDILQPFFPAGRRRAIRESKPPGS